MFSVGDICEKNYVGFGKHLYDSAMSKVNQPTIVDVDDRGPLYDRCLRKMLQTMTSLQPKDRPSTNDIEVEMLGNNFIKGCF